MESKRIYILVKTYPTISEKYAELVCTAGVTADGTWIRLFPMPFRLLNDDQKYPKYTWIDVDAERYDADFRPESYRPNISTLVVHPKPPKADWAERRRIIFNQQTIFTSKEELINQRKLRNISLAVFKPAKMIDFIIENDSRYWDPKKLAHLKSLARQMDLLKTPDEIEEEFRVVRKVPYKFSYKFEDNAGTSSTLMIVDWEIGMLYFNCLKRANGDERMATANVRKKYFDDFVKKDLHFFLGTTKQHHNTAPNPFIIIGIFGPPFDSGHKQKSLFD